MTRAWSDDQERVEPKPGPRGRASLWESMAATDTGVSAAPFIRIEGVTKTFGTFKAVDNVSLDIAKGEMFAPAGRVGLRQDHAAAHARRVRGADVGPHLH